MWLSFKKQLSASDRTHVVLSYKLTGADPSSLSNWSLNVSSQRVSTIFPDVFKPNPNTTPSGAGLRQHRLGEKKVGSGSRRRNKDRRAAWHVCFCVVLLPWWIWGISSWESPPTLITHVHTSVTVRSADQKSTAWIRIFSGTSLFYTRNNIHPPCLSRKCSESFACFCDCFLFSSLCERECEVIYGACKEDSV